MDRKNRNIGLFLFKDMHPLPSLKKSRFDFFGLIVEKRSETNEKRKQKNCLFFLVMVGSYLGQGPQNCLFHNFQNIAHILGNIFFAIFGHLFL